MAPIATMTVRLSAQIAEFQSEFRQATKSAEKFAGSFEGIATRASAVGTFIGSIAARIATSLASAFGQGIRDAIRLSSEFSNAFIGLGSVARAFGTDADQATQAARRLSADGLLPLKDSATGLKNLLAAGFNLQQSTQLMNAFKDSAAFGRQGALSFGDAIRSATEGVKNGNSILVDNAGVTKNLSQILKEAGFSAQDLSRASTDVGVRMALFNGILKETRAQTGDAARLTETYSGQVSRLDTSYNNLLATFGAAITQNATVARTLGAISDALFDVNTQLVNNRNAFNLVSDGVIFLVRALATLLDAADLIQTGFAGLQIASNRLFEAFANIAIAMFKFTERALEVQKYLDPINFKRHAAGAEEARQAYIFLEGAAQGLRDASRDAQNRSTSLGNALQSVRAKALTLAKELEKTRGKTVELGKAGTTAGRDLGTGLEGGAKKATKALGDLQDAIDKSVSGLRIGDLSSLPGFKVDLSKLISIIPPDIPDLKGRIIEGFEGTVKLPGIELELPEPPKIPQTWWQKILTPDPDTASDAFKRLSDDLKRAGLDFVHGVSTAVGDAIRTGDWSQVENAFAEALSTLLSEGMAAAVDFFVPGLGQALKPIFKAVSDKIVDFFGLGTKGRDAVKSFAESFGGFEKLHAELATLGAEGDRLWKTLTQGVGRNSPEQAAQAIDEITAALKRQEEAWGTLVAGVNAKAALFAAPFEKLADAIKAADGRELDGLNAKMAETAQRGQAEFERLGVFVGAAFAGIVKKTGDALGAIKQLGPAFAVLQRGVGEFGLTSTGTIDALLSLFDLVNDAVTGPILESIQATGQIFTGLQDAGILTAELFQTVATDIGASFRDLEAKGGDVGKALALSQPILQKLWEAQQIYGDITDETTAKLLKQAEEQGLVGAHMQDVNQKILDVLIIIADVFGAVIPDALRATTTAGREATKQLREDVKATADAIKVEFADIQIPPLQIDIEYNDPGFNAGSGSVNVPALAHGGIVRRPTLALVGEAGPEAVVPLSSMSSLSPSENTATFIIELDGETLAEAQAPYVPGAARRYVGA